MFVKRWGKCNSVSSIRLTLKGSGIVPPYADMVSLTRNDIAIMHSGKAGYSIFFVTGNSGGGIPLRGVIKNCIDDGRKKTFTEIWQYILLVCCGELMPRDDLSSRQYWLFRRACQRTKLFVLTLTTNGKRRYPMKDSLLFALLLIPIISICSNIYAQPNVSMINETAANSDMDPPSTYGTWWKISPLQHLLLALEIEYSGLDALTIQSL